MSDLLGAEMPLAVRFFLAFLIVLGLIAVTAWAVRRFGSTRGGSPTRGRQPRLAIIDRAGVDPRRQLILVRRDNVEHLLMVGGPTDLVVEANIVRAAAPTRDAALARSAAAPDALPRSVALPEAGPNGSWPLQPEPAAPESAPAPPQRRAARIEPMIEERRSAPPPAETGPRSPRAALAALADDLATQPIAPAAAAAPAPPMPTTVPAAPPLRGRNSAMARPQADDRPIEPRIESHTEAGSDTQSPQLAGAEALAAADQTLAEMAQRLEAALRKSRRTDQRDAGAAQQPADDSAAAAPATMAAAGPARSEGKAKEGKALYDSLEQEMASLLGRQPGSSG
jgi:flagellar protein FliO/FliZ